MSKNNKPIEPLQEKESWQDYLDPQSWSLYPERDNWRRRLNYTLLLWAEDPQALDLVQFSMKYKIPKSTLLLWRSKYEDVRNTLDEVKQILGCRRKIGALKRELDKDMVLKDLHRYDPEWHIEVNKYWGDMKKDEAVANGVQFVVIPQVPSTGLVKPLTTKAHEVGNDQISDHNTEAVLVTKK